MLSQLLPFPRCASGCGVTLGNFLPGLCFPICEMGSETFCDGLCCWAVSPAGHFTALVNGAGGPPGPDALLAPRSFLHRAVYLFSTLKKYQRLRKSRIYIMRPHLPTILTKGIGLSTQIPIPRRGNCGGTRSTLKQLVGSVAGLHR